MSRLFWLVALHSLSVLASSAVGESWCHPTPGKCMGQLEQLQKVQSSEDHPFDHVFCGYSSSMTTTGLQVVDWDGDGALDMLISYAIPGRTDAVLALWKRPVASPSSSAPSNSSTATPGNSIGSAPLEYVRDLAVPFSSAFAATDWDGDGDIDLLLVDHIGVHFFDRVNGSSMQERGAIFSWEGQHDLVSPGWQAPMSAWTAVAVDWDDDGDKDLFLMTDRCNPPLYLQRLSDGSLKLIHTSDSDSPFFGMDLRSSSGEMAAGDWDDDGDVDLVIFDHYSCGFSVETSAPRYFERMADGSLTEHKEQASPFGFELTGMDHVALVDWNADGMLDIVGCNPGYERVELYLRNSDAQLQERAGALSPFSSMVEFRMAPAVVDWNGDGLLDLLVGYGNGNGHLKYFRRASDGTIPSQGEVLLEERLSAFSGGALNPKPVDWDGDGDLDLIVVHFPYNRGFDGTLHYFEQLDNGTFVERSGDDSPFNGLGLDSIAFTVQAVDWDADGDVDLIVGQDHGDSHHGTLHYYERLPNGTMQEQEGVFDDFNVSQDLHWDISAIDWNMDGRLDLVLGNSSDIRYFERMLEGNFNLYERTGDENPFRGRSTGPYPHQAVADWDGDGTLDLITSSGLADSMGALHFFQQGFCEVLEACSSRGYCNPTSGTCDCVAGHTSSDCSVCASGFVLSQPSGVYGPTRSQFRMCSACPGMQHDGQPCSLRGICEDDDWARHPLSLAQEIPLNLSSQHGNGTCLCSPPFHGENCEQGQCSAGLEYKKKAGRWACEPCKPGFYKDWEGNDELCWPCLGNTYAGLNGHTQCDMCESTWWRMQVSDDRKTCIFDPLTLVIVPAILLLSGAFFTLLPFLFSPPIKIQDVRLDEAGVVITTRGKHFLLGLPRGVRVTFSGTGHPLLEGADRRDAYCVRACNDTQLLLLNAEGRAPITAEIDSSMGCLHISPRDALTRTGILGVQFGCWVMLLLLGMGGAFIAANQSEDSVKLTMVELVQVPIGWAVASFLHMRRRWELAHSQLDRDLKTFAGALAKGNPQPRPCMRGPLRAISIMQIQDFFNFFSEHIGSRNMYYVCSNILLPVTRPSQLSYAELAGPHRLQWFCSHFWGTPFAHFVDSVSKHAVAFADGAFENMTYWICTFSNNQWKVTEEVGASWDESSFYLALRSGFCRGTAMILDEEVRPLTRSWCLFELLQTALLSEKQGSDQALPQDNHVAFSGLCLCTQAGVMNLGQSNMDLAVTISQRLATLSLRDASASVLADKQMIDRLVCEKAGGFEQVNKYLIKAVSNALNATQDRFEEDLGRLKRHLSSLIDADPDDGDVAGKA